MKNLVLILFVLCLFSCKERSIDFKLPYEGDKLVVFSQVRMDDTVQVEIQRTYPPTGKSTYVDGINNATVKLFDESKYLETLTFVEKGIYVSSSGRTWRQGMVYKLDITAPGFSPTSTRLEAMPSMPIIKSYEFGRDFDSKFNSEVPAKELIINIEDNSSEEDFYMIVIKRTVGKNTFGVNLFDIDKPNDFEDPCEFMYFSNVVLTDICSSKKIISIKKGIEIRYPGNLDIDVNARDVVTVYTRKISKSYYEFCKSYYNEDDLTVAFKTPYPRYTNVKGGYGIFSAYNEVQKEFVLKE